MHWSGDDRAGVGVRVYLACGVTDMRNYAECSVMPRPRRSRFSRRGLRPGSLHIILGMADAVQHREELIRCAEATRFEHGRRRRCEGFEFLGGVSPQVDLGALEAGVTKPEGDLSDISRRLKGVHGAGVAPMSPTT